LGSIPFSSASNSLTPKKLNEIIELQHEKTGDLVKSSYSNVL
jgi:hypothetical protein